MHQAIQDTQTSLFVSSKVSTIATPKISTATSTKQAVTPSTMRMAGANSNMQLKASMGSSTKMMVGPNKNYQAFSSSNSIVAPSSKTVVASSQSNAKVTKSSMQMNAAQNKEASVIKKAGSQFVPSKYINQSLANQKNIAVEINTPEEPTFQIAGETPDLTAGHLDTHFGHTCKAKISPSLLACDMGDMAAESIRAVAAGADMLHLDIMDGNFVPNLTWGPPVVKALRKVTDAHFDCHIMINNPIEWVEPMADAGADTFTFHLEAMYDKDANGEEVYDAARCNEKTYEMINAIKNASRDMKVGMTLRCDTPIERFKPFLDSGDLDVVMVMTIPLGFGGQKFNEEMMTKVSWLRQNYPTLDIEVDGGLGPATIEQAATAGANIIVAGSAVFNEEDLRFPIAELKRAVEKYGNKMDDDQLTPLPISHDDSDKQQSSGDD